MTVHVNQHNHWSLRIDDAVALYVVIQTSAHHTSLAWSSVSYIYMYSNDISEIPHSTQHFKYFLSTSHALPHMWKPQMTLDIVIFLTAISDQSPHTLLNTHRATSLALPRVWKPQMTLDVVSAISYQSPRTLLNTHRACKCAGCAALAMQAVRMSHAQASRLFLRVDRRRLELPERWSAVGQVSNLEECVLTHLT